MSQSEKPFSVSDRRHFRPDGQLREETATEASGAPAPVPESPPAAPSFRPPSPAAGTTGPSADPGGPAEFGTFLLSLGAQAGVLLSSGGAEDGTDRAQALAAARSIISILEMLRDKTEGRRTEEEGRILDGLLFELRMAYVERSSGTKP